MIEELKIQSIKNNIFPYSLNAIDDFQVFDWHKYHNNIDTDKINSSQGVVIDVFGLLKISPYKDLLINAIFDKSGTDWNIDFEYTDHTLLNEKPSTQIDVVISNTENVLLFECKFMESDSGSCSQPMEQCNGDYKEQTNPKNDKTSHCSLTAKEIKYWDYIPKIYIYDNEENICPCPFKGNQYQFMRNLCFGKALSEKKNINVENYFIYYESEICPIYNKIIKEKYVEKLVEKLRYKDTLKILSYNKLIVASKNAIRKIDQTEYKKWIELEKWLENKINVIRNQSHNA